MSSEDYREEPSFDPEELRAYISDAVALSQDDSLGTRLAYVMEAGSVLTDQLVELAFALYGSMDFDTAASSFEDLSRILFSLSTICKRAIERGGIPPIASSDPDMDAEAYLELWSEFDKICVGYREMCRGFILQYMVGDDTSSSHFTTAASAFRDVARSIGQDDETRDFLKIMAAVADYYIPLIGGITAAMHLDSSNAELQFPRAKTLAEKVLDRLQASSKLPPDDRQHWAAYIQQDIDTCDQLRLMTRIMDMVSEERFSDALDTAHELVTGSRQAVDRFAGVVNETKFGQSLRDRFGAFGKANVLSMEGMEAYAEGHVLREQHKWDVAISCFERAAESWQQAAEEVLRSGVPRSRAQQTVLTGYAKILARPSIRRCEYERKLTKEIDRLRMENMRLTAQLSPLCHRVPQAKRIAWISSCVGWSGRDGLP